MPHRAPSKFDDHDYVDGEIVGGLVEPPPPGATTWTELRHAFNVLSECAAVVAYVAAAEARRGYTESSSHYRRLWEMTERPLGVLRHLATGHEALPVSALDDVRLGVDRLAVALERIARRAEVGKVLGVRECTQGGSADTPVNGRLSHLIARSDTPSGVRS